MTSFVDDPKRYKTNLFILIHNDASSFTITSSLSIFLQSNLTHWWYTWMFAYTLKLKKRLLLYKKKCTKSFERIREIKKNRWKKIAQTILGADHEPIANEIKVRNF